MNERKTEGRKGGDREQRCWEGGREGEGILSQKTEKISNHRAILLREEKAKTQGVLTEGTGARGGTGKHVQGQMAKSIKDHASELRLNPKATGAFKGSLMQ